MSVEIIWDDDAINFLRKLGKIISSRIVKKIKSIKLNPQRYIFSLVNIGYSKIRVGDYRIFVEFENNVLTVRTIKHRKNAYKK
ncbi:MAG: type II toxin-antitoxin system RelE/ParE family toxin [Nanoarchaeota archaeon]|nr:type II toxin-antitoxin system RelE/ParE family toxin [Nanoarchaeota archaeon]